MRLQFFSLEEARIADGRQSWVRQADLWVRVRALRGRITLHRGVDELVATHEVRLRYSSLVHVGARFRNGARILDIHHVNDIGARNKWLSCMCEERRLLGAQNVETRSE